MALVWERARRPWRAGIVALALGVVLVACGDDEDDENTLTGGNVDSTAVRNVFDASPAPGTPARGGLPQDAESETVAIKDGRLDPDDIEGQAGLPFVLIVRGDGAPHTLTIEGIVTTGQLIAPQGETEVSFTIPEGSTGEVEITLDGKEAGTFQVQAAGGNIDQ